MSISPTSLLRGVSGRISGASALIFAIVPFNTKKLSLFYEMKQGEREFDVDPVELRLPNNEQEGHHVLRICLLSL